MDLGPFAGVFLQKIAVLSKVLLNWFSPLINKVKVSKISPTARAVLSPVHPKPLHLHQIKRRYIDLVKGKKFPRVKSNITL